MKIFFAVHNVSDFTMYYRSAHQCSFLCIILHCLCD